MLKIALSLMLFALSAVSFGATNAYEITFRNEPPRLVTHDDEAKEHLSIGSLAQVVDDPEIQVMFFVYKDLISGLSHRLGAPEDASLKPVPWIARFTRELRAGEEFSVHTEGDAFLVKIRRIEEPFVIRE